MHDADFWLLEAGSVAVWQEHMIDPPINAATEIKENAAAMPMGFLSD